MLVPQPCNPESSTSTSVHSHFRPYVLGLLRSLRRSCISFLMIFALPSNLTAFSYRTKWAHLIAYLFFFAGYTVHPQVVSTRTAFPGIGSGSFGKWLATVFFIEQLQLTSFRRRTGNCGRQGCLPTRSIARSPGLQLFRALRLMGMNLIKFSH
jgi:hypothetical protein